MHRLRHVGALAIAVGLLGMQSTMGATAIASRTNLDASSTASVATDEVPCETGASKPTVRHVRRHRVRRRAPHKASVRPRLLKKTPRHRKRPHGRHVTHHPTFRGRGVPSLQHCYVYHRHRLTRADLPLGAPSQLLAPIAELPLQTQDAAGTDASSNFLNGSEGPLGGGLLGGGSGGSGSSGGDIGGGGAGGGGTTIVSAAPEPGAWLFIVFGVALIGESLRFGSKLEQRKHQRV